MADKSDYIVQVRSFNRYFTRLLGLLDRDILNSGYSLAEVRILFELGRVDEVTANKLIELLGIDPSYMSRILAKFEKCNFIEKAVSPKDGRAKIIRLTDKGKSIIADLDHRSTEQMRRFVEPLTEADCQQICCAMELIHSKLGNDFKNRMTEL